MKKKSATNKHEISRKNYFIFFVAFRVVSWLILCLFLAMFASCAQQMGTQPIHKPYAANPVLPHRQLAQKPVFGTVPSGFTRRNRRAESNENFDANTNVLPFPLTEEVLRRGRERFEINCAMCHGLTGEGDGMIVRRGFHAPPSYHEERLRAAPLGHFYDVQTNGFGAMASYADQVEPADRWAIAAYIRALQLSQNASIEDVPPEKRGDLEQEK